MLVLGIGIGEEQQGISCLVVRGTKQLGKASLSGTKCRGKSFSPIV